MGTEEIHWNRRIQIRKVEKTGSGIYASPRKREIFVVWKSFCYCKAVYMQVIEKSRFLSFNLLLSLWLWCRHTWDLLINFMPLVVFCTPWKQKYDFLFFRGYRKRPVAWNGLKIINSSDGRWVWITNIFYARAITKARLP